MSDWPPKLVVAGLVIADDDRVLLTQRRPNQAMPGKWELPGGKIEPGESPTDALARELLEELDVTVSVGRVWDVLFHRYPEFDLLMLVYECRLAAGESPRCRDVEDLAWVEVGKLCTYDVLAADAPLLSRLEREGVPSPRSAAPID